MSSVDWKWVPLCELFNFRKRKKVTLGKLVSTERIPELAFVLWLKTGVFFGTILAHTFSMFKFVVKICLAISFSILNSSVTILMPK
jgi:hypothetical protein